VTSPNKTISEALRLKFKSTERALQQRKTWETDYMIRNLGTIQKADISIFSLILKKKTPILIFITGLIFLSVRLIHYIYLS
jgi:hypothetical protein